MAKIRVVAERPPTVEELHFRSDSAFLCLLLNRRTKIIRVIDFRAGALPAKRLFIQSIAQREGVEGTEEFGAIAVYPLTLQGELHWMLAVALRDTRRWSEADQGLVRAVGRGLNLALERTATARQLALQNAELQARTRALEAFAELTRDLATRCC